MNQYEQKLFKKMMSRILDLEPDRFFLEAGLTAEYKVGEWMRQQFQFVDRETNKRYRATMQVQVAEIVSEDDIIAIPNVHTLMSLVEQQGDPDEES